MSDSGVYLIAIMEWKGFTIVGVLRSVCVGITRYSFETRMDEVPTAIQLNRWDCSFKYTHVCPIKEEDMHPHSCGLS